MNLFFLFWLLLLGIKLLIATFIPIFPDEAYYWVWSKHLQLSYFDHPAMTSWLFFLGTPFESFFSATRLPGVLLGHFSIWIWFNLIGNYLSNQGKCFLLLVLTLNPLSGLGGLILTPDIPLVFFWSLSLWCFLIFSNNPNLVSAAILGASLGGGFCSKYHIVLFFPAALGYLWHSQKIKNIRFINLFLVGLFFLIFSFPTWWWNYKNDFVSFRFQLNHGLGSEISLNTVLKYIIDQSLLVFPLMLFLALKKLNNTKLIWLQYFAWTPLVFFLLTSAKGSVEANWPIAGYPALLSLAIINSPRKPRWIFATISTWLIATVLVLSQITFEWLPFKISKINEATIYKQVLPYTNTDKVLYVSSYQMASMLSFHKKSMIYKLRGVNRIDFFDFLDESEPKADSFYWLSGDLAQLPEWAVARGLIAKVENKISPELIIYRVDKK